MTKVPVLLMTCERADYFKKSFNSLMKTDLSKGEITIFDDFSVDKKKLDMLANCGQKVIHSGEPPKRRFQTQRMFVELIKYYYENYDTDCMVLVQDDIVYNPQWLNKLLEIKDMVPELGILSPWDRQYSGRKKPLNPWIFRNPLMFDGGKSYKNCKLGGVAWLVTRKFVEKCLPYCLDQISKGKLRSNGYDTAFQKTCCGMGFNIAVTYPSYVEHFGTVSIARKGRMRGSIGGYCANNFLGEN